MVVEEAHGAKRKGKEAISVTARSSEAARRVTSTWQFELGSARLD
jgi:hypothetical protein